MSTRRNPSNTKSHGCIRASAGPVASERLDARVTVLAIEQALEQLGIHATLGDIVAKAQSIENEAVQSRFRRKSEQVC